MFDFINLILQGPLALIGTASDALVNWAASCYSGACTSFPQEVYNQIGASLSSIGGFLGSSAATVWTGILFFLPDGGTFPAVFHTSSQYMGNSLATVNFILPVDVLVYCMTLVLSVKIALWSFHVVRVVAGFVRGIPVDRFR